MISAIGSVLSALVAINSIAGYVNSFAQAIILWYVARQNTDALSQIADAAALAARAQTDAERYAAAQAWQTALSRPRVTST